MKAVAACVVFCALALPGCGGGQAHKHTPPVKLTIDSPADMALLRQSSVELTGRVAPPGATVTVEGRTARVSHGRFSATVDLEPGTNLVDVLAGRRGFSPAMLALRVRRELDVSVPGLAGATPGDAEDALAALGLQADVKERGGIIELLLPEDARVCETDPAEGSVVAPGTTVIVHVAKTC